ncbi:vWA domain-containing protein [Tuwongella immobilis]|uniref:Hypothetical conserved protein n=1 Tax=Tuwongella immobilis TaxID=692036 RepID=A0A6C2YRA5_9BACT|nr:vWA domain-containing protein [Tuwongella immobilis]VIP03881.1 Hypothetical conserved protein OS=uncultured planctomycete GN=HGMM_F48A06C24 PE=4 SV=1 [Tuwongella immobilis]VTS05129.1 Hypothetical conserved protein OS=uncultured planctomycete GN=HGMM_F48A06C24 PE=4 SV=1 [Tuwongella immobilis]
MNETGTSQETELFYRRLAEPFTIGGQDVDPRLWLAILIPVLLLGIGYVIWMYRKDTQSIRWYWATFLATLRIGVYLILGYLFLMPAKQLIEKTEKKSRVVMLVDVSPSITEVSDEKRDGSKPASARATRLQKIIDLLTDEKVALLKKLMETNPVAIYRFGGRAEEEPTLLTPESKPLDRDAWMAWAKLDFKPWVLEPLSENGQKLVKETSVWQADAAGDASWALTWLRQPPRAAIPAGLNEDDQKALEKRRAALNTRVEIARQIVESTNIPGSALTVLNREVNNMLQGLIVLSDGRSNRGSESTLQELTDRAKRDGVPVFTIAVGEDRPRIEIRITDVQAPSLTPPDEAFKVYVEADGIGLADRESTVTLELYSPGAETPVHSLTSPIRFTPGEPPHGQAEFVIDPSTLPESLRSKETMFKDLVEGEWRLQARIPRDDREDFEGKEHLSDPITRLQVLKAPLRVLLVASGPGKDFQFLRTLLVRENDRAELSIYLQNDGGRANEIAMDIDRTRVLNRFPDRINEKSDPKEDPEQKFYNLSRYDVILAFDPDWSVFTANQLQLLERWTDQGGGLIFVAGPICTSQLARTDEIDRLRPLLDILPVMPGDNVLASVRRSTKEPWRLVFPGVSPDTDFLKLDEAKDGPLAGWESFFTGKEGAADAANTPVMRGIFNFYPVQSVKKGASVIATFTDPDARGQDQKEPPFLVSMPVKQGRTVFIGSSEVWRLRSYSRAYYERFWLKLLRYASAGNRKKSTRRGRLLMSKEFTARSYIRLQAQLVDPSLQPLPDTATPKITITRLDVEGDQVVPKVYQMSARKSADAWSGMFQRQILADSKDFPPGDYKLELEIPDSTDTLTERFRIKDSNPELDDTQPDFATLRLMASDVEAVASRIEDKAFVESLRKEQKHGDSSKLAYSIVDRSGIEKIPACMRMEKRINLTRGPIEDLWDKGPTLPSSWTESFTDQPVTISTFLLIAVAMLSVEWLTRKLLRLA